MNKYGNKKAVRNGITFDSQKEAARYDQLMLRLCAGEIRDLKLQPEFTLQEAFTTPLGERVRAIKYRADFAYERPTEPDCTYRAGLHGRRPLAACGGRCEGLPNQGI